MQFDLIRLENNIVSSIPIDITYSFSKEQLAGSDISSLDNVKINGELYKNSLGNICLSCIVEGVAVMPCAITLKPVDYPFSVEINGELEELLMENSKKFQNTIDIFPIIWENILMEIPMRVVSPDVDESNIALSGDGWKFASDEESSNNPFSELKDYIDDSEVR